MIVPFSPSLRSLAGWRRRAALGALAVVSLTVSTYVADSFADDPYPRIILGATSDFPLPPSVFYGKTSPRKPVTEVNTPDLFTLAPDDKTPEERIPEIYQRGRIIVGADQSLNLLNFCDLSTGELSGFEVSLTQEIARDTFDNPDAIEFRFVDSNECTAAFKDGIADVVLRIMTVIDARRERVLLSAPYLTARAGILVSSPGGDASPEDAEGGRICVSRGSTIEDLIRRLPPSNTLLLVGSWLGRLISLQNSQAEIVVADNIILAGINDQDPATATVQRGLNEESYVTGVPKGDPDLVRQINATLERMASDGTWQSFYDAQSGPFLPSGTQPSPQYGDDEDILGTSPTLEVAPEGGVDNR